MSELLATDTGGADFEIPPEGTFPAVCVQVVDKGTQHSDEYDRDYHKIMLGWELGDEFQEDERPHIVWQTLTLSLDAKSRMRPMLVAWRGQEFTVEELAGFKVRSVLGAPCMIGVTHNQSADGKKTYANVSSVLKLPKSMTAPKPVRDLMFYNITEHDQQIFETFHDRLQETIMRSPEYREHVLHEKSEDEPTGRAPTPEDTPEHDPDIPF